MKKFLLLLCLFVAPTSLYAAQTITITAPANGATGVSGNPLAITGTSTGNLSPVYISIDGVRVAKVTTTSGGAWSYNYSFLANGSHTVSAILSDSSFSTLATSSTNSFTVSNTVGTIYINYPQASTTIATTVPATCSGSSSMPSTSVQLSMDGTLWATVTTDANGNWSSTFPAMANGSHTLQAVLQSSPTASQSVTFTSQNQINFAAAASSFTNWSVVHGVAPTSGSGSGNGFTYATSASTTTITYSPSLSATPIVVAEAVRIGGTSTVCIGTNNSGSTAIQWTAGATSIHFIAIVAS